MRIFHIKTKTLYFQLFSTACRIDLYWTVYITNDPSLKCNLCDRSLNYILLFSLWLWAVKVWLALAQPSQTLYSFYAHSYFRNNFQTKWMSIEKVNLVWTCLWYMDMDYLHNCSQIKRRTGYCDWQKFVSQNWPVLHSRTLDLLYI